LHEGIYLTEIVLDTGVIIGYGLVSHKAHQYCCRLFEEFPMEKNCYYYPKKVKGELKRVRCRITKKHIDESELRRLYQFVDEFIRVAQEINYEKSTEFNWAGILVVVTRAMKKFQQTSINRISFDANHIAHYVCFCWDKKDCCDHFFVTTDNNLYENKVKIQKDICAAFDEQIEINIRNIWNFL